jgi:hypothetical protein
MHWVHSIGIRERNRIWPDPAAQSLEVFRLENGRWSMPGTHGGEETVRAEPFEALTLELGRLWRR